MTKDNKRDPNKLVIILLVDVYIQDGRVSDTTTNSMAVNVYRSSAASAPPTETRRNSFVNSITRAFLSWRLLLPVNKSLKTEFLRISSVRQRIQDTVETDKRYSR